MGFAIVAVGVVAAPQRVAMTGAALGLVPCPGERLNLCGIGGAVAVAVDIVAGLGGFVVAGGQPAGDGPLL